jgi:broad-specificity NMP kinase
MSNSNERGEVIFLTGPPLAGKTTTAMAWARQRSRVTAPLDWDELHNLLFRGDRLRASTDVDDRYRFAARTAAATAAHITGSGLDCVITGARVPYRPTDPPGWLGHWDDLDQLDPINIVLLPNLQTRLERRRNDPGRRAAMSEEFVRHTHGFGWERWHGHPRAAVLDTSDMDPDEVLAAVEQAVTDVAAQRV